MVLIAGWWAGPFPAGAIVAMALVVRLPIRKIGGLAGDVLGAAEQIDECTVLVISSGLTVRRDVWWA